MSRGENFHSDEWIMTNVREHYEEALSIFPKHQVLGIFLQGSQNYGLDYEKSDIDTKCIVLPNFEDICLNKQPVSHTHVRENNEHIDFKDLRVITSDFKKQNINFLEILFTPYFYINEEYADLFKVMQDNAELIANYNNHRLVKATAGMSMEKLKALTLDRPSQHEEIIEYGWATKQLHHLIRINTFMKRFLNGESFRECLVDPNGNELAELKQFGHNYISLSEAKNIAKEKDKETNFLKENFIVEHPLSINDNTGRKIDNTVINILKRSLRTELTT